MYSIYFILTMVDADNHYLSKQNSMETFDEYFNNNENRITDKLMVLYRSKFFLPCDT